MILNGDVLEMLKTLPDESVQCCVTSPPYWGLRDYGMPGQIGLEKTPEEYVAKMVEVFREVRRVLRSDGVLWLNLGDSYSTGTTSGRQEGTMNLGEGTNDARKIGRVGTPDGLKTKDLVGIPWRVAFALQQPYYTGTIKRVEDRVWLAAMIDGEGCMFIHKRKAGQSNGQGYERKHDSYGAGMEVANTHESIVKRCQEITGKGSICFQDKENKHKDRNLRLFRWNMRSNECRDVVREVYPYLVGKKHEARLLLGCPSSGPDAERAHLSLINLHNGLPALIDFPEPKPMYEPGFYLRQDVIWSKANPMPESVTDRCTKSHEYIFLLTKSARYYYDAEAVKEECSYPNEGKWGQGSAKGYVNNPDMPARKLHEYVSGETRNRRSVWSITTKPFSGAHFATFPPEIPEICIKAGSKEGDTILDPFAGSGTTLEVAERMGRKSIGIELNPKYVTELIEPRLANVNPLFTEGKAI